MKVGIQTPQYGCTVEELARVWQAAERLGFSSAWLMDHLEPIVAPQDTPMLESWTTAAVLAARTERLRFGVLVTANTFRPPALLARMAATLDRASGGRLDVGLGMVGAYAEREHVVNGLAFPSARERQSMLADSCEILRRLWTDPIADYEGTHWSLTAVACEPKPLQTPLPLLIGGTGTGVLDLVARHAERWNGVGSQSSLAQALGRLRDSADAVGRDPSSIELTARNDFFLGRTAQEAAGRLAQMSAFWGTDPEQTQGRMWIGEATQIVQQLEWYRDQGFDEVILGLAPPYDGSLLDMLERVAAEVLPCLDGPIGGSATRSSSVPVS